MNVYNSIVNMRKKITLIKKSGGTRSPAFITKCLAIAARTFQIINVLSLMILKKYKYIENVYKSNSCGFVLPY